MTGEAIADVGSAEADLNPSTDRYADRFRGKAGGFLLARQTAILRDLTADLPGASVLDVGGGHGQSAAPLLEDGHPVTVLSSSPAAFGQAARLDHPGLTLETGPLLQLPFADRSFDVAVSLRMMAHVGDWRRLLAELTRVARRAVIVDFPLPGGANVAKPLLLWAKKRAEGNTRDYDTIARDEVRACLDGTGFEVVREVGQFVLPMVVHRTLGAPGLSGGAEWALRGLGLDRRLGTPVILRADRLS